MREKYWAAHEKIAVRRSSRRLRGEILRLEEDNRILHERIATACVKPLTGYRHVYATPS